MTARELVKMSELSRLTGVPPATIKHYVHAGLVPVARKTSRNMAYYDPSVAPRILRIKELQRTRFLPLKVIKQVLDEADASPEEATAAAIARVLERTDDGTRRTRAQLEDGGLPGAELDFLIELGVVRPAGGRGRQAFFAGDDLEILRVLGAARRAGITREMLPVDILGEYAAALRQLVRAELRLFREGVLPRAGDRVDELAEAATLLSERLVVLIRRKMLLPTLGALVDEPRSTGSPTQTPSSAGRRTRGDVSASPSTRRRGARSTSRSRGS